MVRRRARRGRTTPCPNAAPEPHEPGTRIMENNASREEDAERALTRAMEQPSARPGHVFVLRTSGPTITDRSLHRDPVRTPVTAPCAIVPNHASCARGWTFGHSHGTPRSALVHVACVRLPAPYRTPSHRAAVAARRVPLTVSRRVPLVVLFHVEGREEAQVEGLEVEVSRAVVERSDEACTVDRRGYGHLSAGTFRARTEYGSLDEGDGEGLGHALVQSFSDPTPTRG